MGYKEVKYQRLCDDHIIIFAVQDQILVKERKSTLYINKSYPVMKEYVDYKHGIQTTDIKRSSSVFIPRRQPSIFDDTPLELKYKKFLEEIAASKVPAKCVDKGSKEIKIKDYPRFLNPFEEGYYFQKNIIPDIKHVTKEAPIKDDKMAEFAKTETNKNSEDKEDPMKDNNMAKLLKTENNKNSQDVKTTEEKKPKSNPSKYILNRFKRRITNSFRLLFKTV